MVLVRLLYCFVRAEALVGGIVRVIDLCSLPILLALDAEVVVRTACQVAVAAVRLEDALCHSDAGRDTVTLHMVDGYRLVAVDILLLGLSGLRRRFAHN